jgi:ribA/ribD-fused uncharacterized protein
MTTEINFYRRKEAYGWLSNFWRAPQVVNGITYPTNENYYQSQKALFEEDAERIRQAKTPFEAMTLGRALPADRFRPDWDRKKVSVMLEGLRAKFSQNHDLRDMLLATGDAAIHEDSPTDIFWGKRGQDMLGRLLMQVRARAYIDFGSSTWSVSGTLTMDVDPMLAACCPHGHGHSYTMCGTLCVMDGCAEE